MISLDKVKVNMDDASTVLNNDGEKKNFNHPLYLRGPVDWQAILMAARSRGHSLQVFLIIMFYVGIKKSRTIDLCTKYQRAMGFSRHSTTRALRHLKEAGLIDFEILPGRLPKVTVLETVKFWWRVDGTDPHGASQGGEQPQSTQAQGLSEGSGEPPVNEKQAAA